MVRPDDELVRAALGGDKDAFAELITRHWATAVALATRLLGSADLARDAAQEASIAALTGLGRLRDPERFGPWYCGIALNVARRWRRQLRAEPAAVLPDQASAEPARPSAPSWPSSRWRSARPWPSSRPASARPCCCFTCKG